MYIFGYSPCICTRPVKCSSNCTIEKSTTQDRHKRCAGSCLGNMGFTSKLNWHLGQQMESASMLSGAQVWYPKGRLVLPREIPHPSPAICSLMHLALSLSQCKVLYICSVNHPGRVTELNPSSAVERERALGSNSWFPWSCSLCRCTGTRKSPAQGRDMVPASRRTISVSSSTVKNTS